MYILQLAATLQTIFVNFFVDNVNLGDNHVICASSKCLALFVRLLFCYTGTGASMTANKVPGIRAALCADAETARGAKWWNDAKVLVISLRAISTEVANEILTAWFSEEVHEEEKAFIDQFEAIDKKYRK